MNQNNRKFLGVVILIFGVLFLFDRLNIFEFNIFFAGWWTLLLIIPAIYSMSKQGITLGNTILLAVGVVLFLREKGWDLFGYLVPAILIILGIGLLFNKK